MFHNALSKGEEKGMKGSTIQLLSCMNERWLSCSQREDDFGRKEDFQPELSKHSHQSCGSSEREWLPYEVRGERLFLKLHPYCIHCGSVKNIGPDRPKGIGYYSNALSRMKEDFGKKISETVARLIMMKISSIQDFEDNFSMTRWAQERAFIQAVKDHTNLNEELIRGYL